MWRDFLAHDGPDEYWERMSARGKFDTIQAPIYLMGGWFDYYPGQALEDYNLLRAAGKTAKVLIGPWWHILSVSSRLGDVDFGAHSHLDLRQEYLRWYDALMKGVDNGILDEPPIRYFTMGVNEWRNAHAWPLPDTQYTPFYLHADGELSLDAPGEEAPDRYTYDPDDPRADHRRQPLALLGRRLPRDSTRTVRPTAGGGARRRAQLHHAPLEEDVEATGGR